MVQGVLIGSGSLATPFADKLIEDIMADITSSTIFLKTLAKS